jgi:hypothetical protein
MRRFSLRVAFGVLLTVGLMTEFEAHGQTSVDSSKHAIYSNHVYDFQVAVPPGVTYTRTLPPNPDHGIGVESSDHNKLWVDASYTESSSTDEEASKQSADCNVEQQQMTSLGGMPALLIHFSCAASSAEKAYEEKLVLLVHRAEHRAPVCYEIGIRATERKISSRADELFEKLVASSSFPKQQGAKGRVA